MNAELKGYLKTEMTIAAAFNFFVNGMAAGLIHHKADYVPVDLISIAIDLTCTCLCTFILTALFCRASLRRTKTEGILDTNSRFIRFSSRLFRRPVLFGVVMGLIAAAVLTFLSAGIILMIGAYVISFGIYVVLKCVFAAFLGAGVTLLELYSGMCKAG